MPLVDPAADAHAEIDVHFQGIARAICCHAIDGYLVDPGPESSVGRLLAGLGDHVPRGVLLTHIHFDHAGATGALVRRWPELEVWVHERGARHLVDPSRLVASATRIYGDAMERLWGRIEPVPEANVRVLADARDPGPPGFDWAYTPGHAVHHVAYHHRETRIAFTGDLAGVRVKTGPILPPTPPPDIDVELWHRSIEIVRAWQPTALAVTHFGTFQDAEAHLAQLHDELDRWAADARTSDATAFEAAIRTRLSGTPDELSYLTAMPPETLYAGLARYWQRRDTAS